MKSKDLQKNMTSLNKMLAKYYGKRCKDYQDGCIVCRMWHAYDVIENNMADVIGETRREEKKK